MSVGERFLPDYYVEAIDEAQEKFTLGVIFFPDMDFPQNLDCVGSVTKEQFKRYVKDRPEFVDTMNTTRICSNAKVIHPEGVAYEIENNQYCGISISTTPGHTNDENGIYCGNCGDFVSSIRTEFCQYPTTNTTCFDSVYLDYCKFDLSCKFTDLCDAGGYYKTAPSGKSCDQISFLNQTCYACRETCIDQIKENDSGKASYLVAANTSMTTLPTTAYGPRYFSSLSKCSSMATPTITVTSNYEATSRSSIGLYNVNINMTGKGAYGSGGESDYGNDYLIRLGSTLILKDVTVNLSSDSVYLTNPRFCSGTISMQGNSRINGSALAYNFCTSRIDRSYLDVESGANAYIKNLSPYVTKTQVKAGGILSVDKFQMHGTDEAQVMQIYGKLYAKSTIWTNGGVKVYSTGKFQSDSWKADSTYKGTIYFEKGAQIKVGSDCKKMSSTGNITISANYTSLPSSFSGTSCDSNF